MQNRINQKKYLEIGKEDKTEMLYYTLHRPIIIIVSCIGHTDLTKYEYFI